MKRIFSAMLGGVLLFAQGAFAQQAGDLTIDRAYGFATPPSASAGAGYMTIVNGGDAPDRLIAVRADFAHTMLHKSVMEDGTMKMIPQKEGVEVPAGATVSFEPGGLHVMFMKLSAPFKEGQSLPVTLVFENAGEIPVEFAVKARNAESMDHGDHGKKAHTH